jgi:hypothetical protein
VSSKGGKAGSSKGRKSKRKNKGKRAARMLRNMRGLKSAGVTIVAGTIRKVKIVNGAKKIASLKRQVKLDKYIIRAKADKIKNLKNKAIYRSAKKMKSAAKGILRKATGGV